MYVLLRPPEVEGDGSFPANDVYGAEIGSSEAFKDRLGDNRLDLAGQCRPGVLQKAALKIRIREGNVEEPGREVVFGRQALPDRELLEPLCGLRDTKMHKMAGV